MALSSRPMPTIYQHHLCGTRDNQVTKTSPRETACLQIYSLEITEEPEL